MSPIAAIGFDLDGTLFDHEGAARAAVVTYLDACGWQTEVDAGDEWMRLEYLHFDAHMRGEIDFSEQRRRRIGGLLRASGVSSESLDLDALFEEYLSHYEAAWTLFPEVASELTRLGDQGLRLAVLTNGHLRQQLSKLERTGIREHFDVVLAASELAAFKPDPAVFAALCSALDLPAHSVMYVGDDVVADVDGARDAGLTPFWIDRRAGTSLADIVIPRG